MSYFDRNQQSANAIRHKAETEPGYDWPKIDTAMGQSARNERWVNNREAQIRRKNEGPNATADIGMLAMGVVRKAEVPSSFADEVAKIRDTHPIETSVTLDNIAAELKKLFLMLNQADKARLLAELADQPKFNSPVSGAGMDPLQVLQEQGRVTFKNDFQIPPSLFGRTTSAMRSIKKADDGVGRIDLSKLFTQQAWA